MACNSRNVSGILCSCIASLLLLSCSGTTHPDDSTQIIELNSNWWYRSGDSPVDSTGRLIWLNDTLNAAGWIAVDHLNEIPREDGAQSLWLRIRLPHQTASGSRIFTDGVRHAMQVWLEDQQIYQYGAFQSIEETRFLGWRQHLIPLPDHSQNRMLTLRIWSGNGAPGIGTPIRMGPACPILRTLLISDLDAIVLGALFILLAVMVVVFYSFVSKDALFLQVALFLMAMGIFIISNSYLLQTVFNAPSLFFYLDIFSLLIAPVAGYLLVENCLIPQYKPLIRRLWQIHLIFLVCTAFAVWLVPSMNFEILYNLFFGLSAMGMAVCSIIFIKSRRQMTAEIKILMAGIGGLFISIAIELLTLSMDQVRGGESMRITSFHYGALCLVVSLIWMAVRRYMVVNRQKEAAQKEAMESVIHREQLKNEMTRNRLEAEKWQELNRLKSQFLANISHEFRTPLTLILGMSRQLINEDHNEVVTERSRMQEKHGQRLLRQVNNLLDLSRLDAGHVALAVAQQDIIPLIKGVFHAFESYARQHQIDTELNLETEAAALFYDADKIETVLSNLLSNAFKFTPSGGEVAMVVSLNDHLEIQVSDTGPGIEPAHLPYIFDRFYQAGRENETDQRGSGIGLALCHELVRLHHGALTVDSSVGSGTTFQVQLPLGQDHFTDQELGNCPDKPPTVNIVVEEAEKRIQTPPPLTSSSSAEYPLLLVVEDNGDMRAYIREILATDYRIEEAVDGEEGLAKAVEVIPDLIISDVMMPKMDGYTLCDALKSDQRTSHIPVVLLTARSGKESRLTGLKQGADDYLVKPFESDELKIRAKNLIDLRRKLRDHFRQEVLFGTASRDKSSSEEAFIQRVTHVLDRHLQNPELDINVFSREVGLSRSQLHRKLQGITGQSASEFIRSLRLKKAAALLEEKTVSVSDIAYQTGFSNHSYFSKCFRAQFGISPSQYGQRDNKPSAQ